MVKVIARTTYNTHVATSHMSVIIGELTLIILLVIATNLTCVLKIRISDPQIVKTRKSCVHATLTVLILSTVFCFFNVLYVTALVQYFYLHRELASFDMYLGLFYAIPLNSAVNPAVYLVRNSDMRRYLKEIAQNIAGLQVVRSLSARSTRTNTLKNPTFIVPLGEVHLDAPNL